MAEWSEGIAHPLLAVSCLSLLPKLRVRKCLEASYDVASDSGLVGGCPLHIRFPTLLATG